MTRLQSGAIPFRTSDRQGLELLLVTSRRRGRWVFPKGNIKRGMLPHASAAHEAFEEAGVRGKIGNLPICVYRQRKPNATSQYLEVTVQAFALRVTDEHRWWPEMAIRRREWMSVPQALDVVNDTALRSVINAFATAFADEKSDLMASFT